MASVLVPAIAILIAILGIITAVVGWKYRKAGRRHEPDYYAFFVIGLIWTAGGAAFMAFGSFSLSGLFAIGLVFLAVGIVNRAKWKNNKKKWSDMYKWPDGIMLVLVAAGVILLVVGIAAFVMME